MTDIFQKNSDINFSKAYIILNQKFNNKKCPFSGSVYFNLDECITIIHIKLLHIIFQVWKMTDQMSYQFLDANKSQTIKKQWITKNQKLYLNKTKIFKNIILIISTKSVKTKYFSVFFEIFDKLDENFLLLDVLFLQKFIVVTYAQADVNSLACYRL